MNSERKLITEYFNKYYPKKTYYVHNEVFELLLGVFFGFFFSALKDSIGNRAVQVVSSFQDEGKSKRFFDEAEKVTSELERYAKENKELSDKLKKIEEVLQELKSNTTASRETSNSAEPRPTPEPEKDSPVVSELSNFTTQVLQLLQELQNNSKKQTQELRDSVEFSQKVLISALQQIGVDQQTLIKKFNEKVQKAQDDGSIRKEDVSKATQALSVVLPKKTEEAQQVEKPKSKKGDKERTKKNKPGVSTLSNLLKKNQLSLEAFLSGVVRFAKKGESTYTVTKGKNNNFTFNFVQSTLSGKSLNSSVHKENGQYVFTVEDTVFGESLYSLYSYFVTLYEQDGVTVVTVSATLNAQDTESVFFTVKESELKSVGLLVQESDTTDNRVTVAVSDTQVTFNDGNKEVNFVLGNSTSVKNARKLLTTLLRSKKVTKSDVKSAIKKLNTVKTKLLPEPQTVSVSNSGQVTVGNTTLDVSVPEQLHGKKVEVQNLAVIERLKNKSTSLADVFLSSTKKLQQQALLPEPEPTKPQETNKKEEVVNTKEKVEKLLNNYIEKKTKFSFGELKTNESFVTLKSNTTDEQYFSFTKIEKSEVEVKVNLVNFKFEKVETYPTVTLESTRKKLHVVLRSIFEAESDTEQQYPGYTGTFTVLVKLSNFSISEKGKLQFNSSVSGSLLLPPPTVLNKHKEVWLLVKELKKLVGKKYPISTLVELKNENQEITTSSDSNLQEDYYTFDSVSEEEVTTSVHVNKFRVDKATVQNFPFEGAVYLEKYTALYEATEDTTTFTMSLSTNKYFKLKNEKVYLTASGVGKVLDLALKNQPEKTTDTTAKPPESEVKAPEVKAPGATPEQPTVSEKPTEKKPQKVERWPELLYYAQKKRGTLPLKENSPLLTESPQSGTFVRLKYDSVDKTTNVATYVGEVEYDAKTALPKSALSAVLEVVLNQERGQQLKVLVASYSKDESGRNQYSVVRVLQKGKLTSDSSNVLTRLLSTGDRGANQQLARENFVTGVLKEKEFTITVKNYTKVLENTEDKYVVVLPVGNKLLYFPLNKDELPSSLTALRSLARVKNEEFNFKYGELGNTGKVIKFDKNTFMSTLPGLLEKVKQLVGSTNYSNALKESRSVPLPPVKDASFGLVNDTFNKETGFKNSYVVKVAQERLS